MASELTLRDKDLLSAGNRIRIGNKPYENGIFGTRESRDFIYFQISDVNNNSIESKELPFSYINLTNQGTLLLQPPRHFMDSEITSGTYNITYRFFRRLAGKDENILVRTEPNAGDGKFYIWEDYENIEITDDGLVYEKKNVNEDYFERGQQLQIKSLKYQIDAISPSRTEVRVRAQNFEGMGISKNYNDEFFELGESLRKTASKNGSFIRFINNNGENEENLNQSNTLQITTVKNDFVFTPRMIDGTIVINDVYLTDTIISTPTSEFNIARNGGGETVIYTDLGNVKNLADEYNWDANLHSKAIEVADWTTGFLSYLNKPTSDFKDVQGYGYFAHWVQGEGKDGGVCMKFPDINQEYEQTIQAWPVGQPHRPLLITQQYAESLQTLGVSHGDNILVSFDIKSSISGKPVRITTRYPDEALTESEPTGSPAGFWNPEDDPPSEVKPSNPDGYVGYAQAPSLEDRPPARLNDLSVHFDLGPDEIATLQYDINNQNGVIGRTTATAPFGGAGVWIIQNIVFVSNIAPVGGDTGANIEISWGINESYSGFNLLDGLLSELQQWRWNGYEGRWVTHESSPYPDPYPNTVSSIEFPDAVNAHPYTPEGQGIPIYERTTNVGQNKGWVTGTVVGDSVHLFKDDLVWKVIQNASTADDLKVFTFREWLEAGGYREGNNGDNSKLFIDENGDSIVDQTNGKPLDYHIFANGGFIQSVTRGFSGNQLASGYIVAFNDGLGTDNSNKIAELGRPSSTREIRIKAVRNLNQILDNAIVTNNNRYEITARKIGSGNDTKYEYHFLVGNQVYQSNDGDGDFFATNNPNNQLLEELSSGFSVAIGNNNVNHFPDFIDYEPRLMLESFGTWSRHHFIKFDEPQLVKKPKSDFSGIEENDNINDIFYQAGVLDDEGAELEFGVLNPAATNYTPNALYSDINIEPEFDWTGDPRKTGTLSPGGLWRWSGDAEIGWEYQGVTPIQYSYRRPEEPWVRTTKSNEWERLSVSIPVRDNWLLSSTSPWQIYFEGHDISEETDTFGITWIDNVDVRFEFVGQSTTQEVLKPYVAQIKSVSDDGITITTNKTFEDGANEVSEDDEPAEAFYNGGNNDGIYSSYQSEYLVFNPRELRTYIKYQNQFFLTTNFRQDRSAVSNYPYSIVFKLYDALPDNINRFDEVTFVKEMVEPSVETMRVVDFIPEETGDRVLRSPNLNNAESGLIKRTTNFKTENDILTSDKTISDLLRNQFLSQSIDSVELNVDYSNYNNFVNFSSVEQRLRNFQYKLTQIETYNTLSGSLTDDSGSLKDIKNWESQISDIKNNFDGFEKYMYYESSSYITSSLGEFYDNSWPKVSGDGSVRSPYVLAHTTSSEGLNWFNENITSASLYDEENINKLSTLLPDHIKFDTNNETYIKFTDMVAHHFDNIWLYIKSMGDVYDRREKLSEGIPKDLLYSIGRSLGWTLDDGKDLVSLPRFSTGAEVTGSSFSDFSATKEKDLSREIWSRIINNMPFFLKHKGTIKALKGLINIYGIPSTILRVKEYGGPDVPNDSTPQFEIRRKFTKALDFRGGQFVTTPWSGSLTNTNRKPDSVEFRFRAATGSNQILVEKKGNDASSSFFIRLKNNNSNDNYGYVAFQLSGSDGLKEVSSSNFPVYDGDFYSVMLRRTSGSDASNVSQSFQLAVGKYDAGRSKIQLYSAVTMSTDIAASSSYNLAYANDGLIYIGGSTDNALVGEQLSGSIMEYRHWTETLGVKHFKNHIANPQAYDGNSVSSSYENLVLRYSFNDNKNLFTDVEGIRDISSRATTTVSGSHSGFSGNFYRNVVDETKTNIPSIGGLRRVTNKIRIESNPIKEGETLQRTKRATVSQYDRAPNDSNKVGIYFAPTDVINNDIIDSVADLNFDNYLGDPRDVTETSYRGLNYVVDNYWKKYTSPNNFWDYIRLLKYYDQSLFPQLKKLIPARSKSNIGLLIEPNILERPKVVKTRKASASNLYLSSSIDITQDFVSITSSYNTGIAVDSYTSYDGLIKMYSNETGVSVIDSSGSYNTQEGTISELKDRNFRKTIWSELGTGFYITSSITQGDTLYAEVLQPNITGSRIYGNNQKLMKIYNTAISASLGLASSSSFKNVDLDNLVEQCQAKFNSYYAGVKNTESTTIDGGPPVEITITSPTKLITQVGGDSTLKTKGESKTTKFKRKGKVTKGSSKLGKKGRIAKATGEDTDDVILPKNDSKDPPLIN